MEGYILFVQSVIPLMLYRTLNHRSLERLDGIVRLVICTLTNLGDLVVDLDAQDVITAELKESKIIDFNLFRNRPTNKHRFCYDCLGIPPPYKINSFFMSS